MNRISISGITVQVQRGTFTVLVNSSRKKSVLRVLQSVLLLLRQLQTSALLLASTARKGQSVHV